MFSCMVRMARAVAILCLQLVNSLLGATTDFHQFTGAIQFTLQVGLGNLLLGDVHVVQDDQPLAACHMRTHVNEDALDACAAVR